MSARLPGVRIDATPPPVPEALPPMDVAVFVGFAATGPVHRPVAIDSPALFRDAFGADLALALDSETGERVYANLGPAVRSFFSNGGRRCWVIRVARTAELESAWCRILRRDELPQETATANHFPIPGVLACTGIPDHPRLVPAYAQARSLGSWSDSIRVSSALLSANVELAHCSHAASPTGARIRCRAYRPMAVGDLIELDDGADSAGSLPSAGSRTFAIVEPGERDGVDGPAPFGFEATLCATFKPLVSSLGIFAVPRLGTAVVCGRTDRVVAATLRAPTGASAAARLHFADGGPPGLSPGLHRGQWVCWTGSGAVVWLRVDRHIGQTQPTELVVEGPAWEELTPILPDPAPTRAKLLTLDLQVQTEAPGGRVARSGIGLTPRHHAAWWRQLSDDLYYVPAPHRPGSGTASAAPARADAFPLSVLDKEVDSDSVLAWIPLGVDALYGASLAPLSQSAAPLGRDGLSRFDAELFLDPDLASRDTSTLMKRAEFLRFVADDPRSLFGIHGAFEIGSGDTYSEASLIAAPDAIQPGWRLRPHATPPPPRPAPQGSPAHWATHRGPCARVSPDQSDDSAADRPDFSRFLDCGTRRLAPPRLSGPNAPVPRGAFRLEWDGSQSADFYVLEEAFSADFSDARKIYQGSGSHYLVPATREGNFNYRVTAFSDDERSAASNALSVSVRDDQWILTDWAEDPGEGASELLRIHRGLLRLAAASGDLFAVLALPRRFRAPEAIGYSARLRASFRGRASDDNGLHPERRALSFGALYHPWIQYADSAPSGRPVSSTLEPPRVGTRRTCSPDGSLAGALAARALERGVWIAPANEPLKGLVALTPGIVPSARLSLQEGRINLIRNEPGGFLCLCADTLSDDDDWKAINVRRLFSLLRRLVLRRGMTYVFEPNDDVLQRAVERGFAALLTELHQLGAFAGTTPEESFRIATGEANNTPADLKNGRFFVDLRIAPSLPLRFLGLRLLLRGERLALVEET